jgi:peroxiredoxin
MFRFATAVLVAAGLALVNPLHAADKAKTLSIGDAAPQWKDLEGVDGKKHSLADLKDKDVVVLVITCNHCPVAVAYEDRIIDFAKKHASAGSKVGLVAVNVNNLEADKMPAMKSRAKEKGFNFAYLYDPTQKIAKDYNAKVTPEFYVLNKDRKVVYHGAMDDSMKSPKVNYLEAAVTAALKNEKPTTAETTARGCTVKFDSK